jgi:DNA polymerase/3'-5' exonuclease PolX
MELEKARAIAEEMKSLLELGCHRIEIVGSIRRQKPEVENVELLCIPKIVNDVDKLEQEIIDLMLRKILGFRLDKRSGGTYSPKSKLMLHIPSGIGVDIFSTDFECWPIGSCGENQNWKESDITTLAIRWHMDLAPN